MNLLNIQTDWSIANNHASRADFTNVLQLTLTGVVHQRLPQHLPSQHRHQAIHVTSHQLRDRIARNRWSVHRQQCVCWTFYGKFQLFTFIRIRISFQLLIVRSWKQSLGIEAFPRFRTRRSLTLSDYCILGWHHVQSEFIARRASSRIAVAASIVSRRYRKQSNAFRQVVDAAQGESEWKYTVPQKKKTDSIWIDWLI